jgi:hypothetical protein
MTDEIRNLLMALPVKDLQETQAGNHVYFAKGQVKIGSRYYPGVVRIWLSGENISVSVKSRKAGFNVIFPFNSEAEQARAPRVIGEAIQKHLN